MKTIKLFFLNIVCLMALSASAQVPEGYVDLGLPSGTLWKAKNERGFYTYKQALKFNRQLPTKEQFEELRTSCKWTWNGYAYKVIGPNGNFIILPVEGRFVCDTWASYVSKVKDGFYWSITPYDSSRAWGLFINGGGPTSIAEYMQCNGFSVRLVQSK